MNNIKFYSYISVSPLHDGREKLEPFIQSYENRTNITYISGYTYKTSLEAYDAKKNYHKCGQTVYDDGVPSIGNEGFFQIVLIFQRFKRNVKVLKIYISDVELGKDKHVISNLYSDLFSIDVIYTKMQEKCLKIYFNMEFDDFSLIEFNNSLSAINDSLIITPRSQNILSFIGEISKPQ